MTTEELRKGRGRYPTTPIILPDGREVLGWKAAEAATGHRRTTMLARATWDYEARAWRVRTAGERRRIPGTRYDRLVAVANAAREWKAAREAINAAQDMDAIGVALDEGCAAVERLCAALDALEGGEARP